MTLACSMTSQTKSRTRPETGARRKSGSFFDSRMRRRTGPKRRQKSATEAMRSAAKMSFSASRKCPGSAGLGKTTVIGEPENNIHDWKNGRRGAKADRTGRSAAHSLLRFDAFGCVARVDDQLRLLDDGPVVVTGVIGDDDYGVVLAESVQGRAGHVQVVVPAA